MAEPAQGKNVYELLGIKPPAPAGSQPSAPPGSPSAELAAPAPAEATTDAAPKRTPFGTILKEEALATPGRVYDSLSSLPGRVLNALTVPDPESVLGRKPRMQTVLPLAIGGPAGPLLPGAVAGASSTGFLTRLASQGAGAILDNPKETPAQNFATLKKTIIGDSKDPVSVLTSPAAMEAYMGVGGTLMRGRLQGAAQERYARRVGQNLEEATGGVLPAPQSAADMDALVRGAQD